MLQSTANFKDMLDASTAASAAMKAGLPPVEAKVALVKACPEDAVLQLCGDVPDEALSRMPNEWLYWRMCELEALRVASSEKVERLFLELWQRGYMVPLPGAVKEESSASDGPDTVCED